MNQVAQDRYAQRPLLDPGLTRATSQLFSFFLAASVTLAITISAAFYSSFSSTRLAMVLLTVLALHLLTSRRVLLARELIIYVVFVVYMLVQLTWTSNAVLALNTLFPAFNFIVIIGVFGSLVAFHNTRAVLLGISGGVTLGALYYSMRKGFPLVYPEGFSYNAMAVLYIFGLSISLLLSSIVRPKRLFLLLGVMFGVLTLATTSIKANLGIFLGVVSAWLIYRRLFGRLLIRNFIPILIILAAMVVAIGTNDQLTAGLQKGVSRIGLGLEILQARDDIAGYGGYGKRSRWAAEGLKGWARSPVFGHGVEAFRNDFGITSHATPIDLLYNSGVIGLTLFYSMFLSMFWRLYAQRREKPLALSAVVLGSLVCFSFITMSGTMHYNTFLAAFIGISTGLLRASPSSQDKGSGQ